jgi:hypothetical protein
VSFSLRVLVSPQAEKLLKHLHTTLAAAKTKTKAAAAATTTSRNWKHHFERESSA